MTLTTRSPFFPSRKGWTSFPGRSRRAFSASIEKTANNAGDFRHWTGSANGIPSTSANRPACSRSLVETGIASSSGLRLERGQQPRLGVAHGLPAEEHVQMSVGRQNRQRAGLLGGLPEVLEGVPLAVRQETEVSFSREERDAGVRARGSRGQIRRQTSRRVHRNQRAVFDAA